jgi:hypothetical protein
MYDYMITMILHPEHNTKIQKDHHTKCEHEKYTYVINIINAVCDKRAWFYWDHQEKRALHRTTQPNKNNKNYNKKKTTTLV